MNDFKHIGLVVAKLVPTANMVIKLDIMGDNSCARWHRDNYVGRAVVSYNSCGTEFVDHQNVDFWELENCGNNLHIIRDSSQICAASVGSILFMKGTRYPSGENGLVHKSPETQRHAN